MDFISYIWDYYICYFVCIEEIWARMKQAEEKAIEIKTTEELSVTDYTKVAGKKWVSYEDYKEQ